MHMFESATSKFNRYFGIRDQEVKMNTTFKAKSPQQIKREHMKTSIPMFADSLKQYRLKKSTINLKTHAEASGSPEKIFLIRDKSAEPPQPWEVGRYRTDVSMPKLATSSSQIQTYATEHLLHDIIEPKHEKRKAFYQYDLKRPFATKENEQPGKSMAPSLSHLSLGRIKPKKKLGEILQPGLLDMRMHPVHTSQLQRETASQSHLQLPVSREHASHFA